MLHHPNSCSCGGSHAAHRHLSTNAELRRDPTRTTTLRRSFEKEINKRFARLRKLIKEAIVTRDVLGLSVSTNATLPLKANVTTLPPVRAFQFERSGEKVSAFMDWVNGAAYREILGTSIGTPQKIAGADAWSNVYVHTAYQRGLAQAGGRLRKEGVEVSDRWIDAAFLRPVHADRAGLIFTRTYESLTGVTDAMSSQISRELALGIAEGRGVQAIAKSLNDRVDKVGRTRARTLARTEVVAAHAEASLNAYAEAGVEGVNVQAEWATAGDDAVCPECAAMEGRTFTIEQSRGMIPLHPNCRCAFIPVVKNLLVEDNVPVSSPASISDKNAVDLIENPEAFSDQDYSGIRGNHSSLPGYVDEINDKAMNFYGEEGYTEINNYLRNGGHISDEAKGYISELNTKFKPIQSDMVVYRGIEDLPDVAGFNVGDKIKSGGFTSTSRLAGEAEMFAGDGYLFQIRLPKGTKALVTNPQEAEVILGHNTQFQVRRVLAQSNGPDIIEVDIIK